MENHLSRFLAQSLAVASFTVAMAASAQAGNDSKAAVSSKPFGKTLNGEKVEMYTLANSKGVKVSIATYGATIVDLITPDRNGKPADIALGFDTLKPYLTKSPYFGATIGRYANRIAKGKFSLDGKTYSLAANNGANALHGGLKGFDKRVWKAEVLHEEEPTVRFTLHSADGEEGYPGNMNVTVEYSLNDKNELEIEFTATTDKKTIVNLTNHTYFNLSGAGNGTILSHEMMIPADHYTPVDGTLIPTGELKPVAGTVMDFRRPTPIGARIKEVGGKPVGYDHNYVLNRSVLPGLDLNGRVHDPASGRVLEVYSDQPGVQFYSGNFLDGSLVGKGGKTYPQYGAFCLEPQHFPDSPNKPHFPSVVLEPGHAYRAKIVFRFSAK